MYFNHNKKIKFNPPFHNYQFYEVFMIPGFAAYCLPVSPCTGFSSSRSQRNSEDPPQNRHLTQICFQLPNRSQEPDPFKYF